MVFLFPSTTRKGMDGYKVSPRNTLIDVRSNQEIRDKDLIKRIMERVAQLKVPPAYKDVVISKAPNAKVMACARDAKGRKQCMYHPTFVATQQRARYAKIERLDSVFKRIARRVQAIVKRPASAYETKEYQIAMVLHIMLLCNFRIGTDKYVRTYGTFGVSTLLWRHISFISANRVDIRFIGKKGVVNESSCLDTHLCSYMRHCKKAPSRPVFPAASADDVNMWLDSFAPGEHITSKDIRTWQANRLFTRYLQSGNDVKTSLKLVAQDLHHTPHVCKTNYIDPKYLLPTSSTASKQKLV